MPIDWKRCVEWAMGYLEKVGGDMGEAGRILNGSECHEAAYHGIMALVEKAEHKSAEDDWDVFNKKYCGEHRSEK